MSTNIFAKQKREWVARTEGGLEFERWLKTMRKTLANPEKQPQEIADDIREMNDRLRHVAIYAHRNSSVVTAEMLKEIVGKELTIGDVQTTPVLQDLSVQYVNDEYIGKRIMPVFDVAAGTGSATYWRANKENGFSYPSDAVSPLGAVNRVDQSFTKTSATLDVRALKAVADANVRNAMDAPVAALFDAMLPILDGLEFNDEMRIAAIAGSAGSFGSNTAAITAGDRWDTEDGGDPEGAVDTAKDALFMGPGPAETIGVCSVNVFNVLKRNPRIKEQFKYTSRESLTRQMLAEFFGLDELLVGRARKNTANEGQTASYSRVWPDVFGVFHVTSVPAEKVATFGLTLETPHQEQEWYEPGVGGFGAFNSQNAYMNKSVVICADCGYLLTTPIGS